MTDQIKPERLRRTVLLTPGNRAERLRKAATLDVDAVVFDIEDGVGPDQKSEARDIINSELTSLDFAHRERAVRVNAVGTPEFDRDMEALSFDAIDTVFVPKVESPDQLTVLDDLLTTVEMSTGRSGRIDVIATIETPRGLLNALAIADAGDRTSALFFGSGDYSAATGGAVTETALAFPRATIVAAAAAAGIQAIDAAYFLGVKDAEATREDALLAKDLGFAGKVIFHPNQIDVCNQVFSPGAEEIARARKIVDAHAVASADGHGVAYSDGEFVALDIVLMAQRTLHRAEQIAARTTR